MSSARRDARSQPVADDRAPPVRSGEVDALYREHFDFVWRTLRRLGVRPSALDDATQEVFLVVHRRLSDFRPGSSHKAWLFAIAQRVASDQRRWVRRKGHVLPLADEFASTVGGPHEAAERQQASDLVLEFLAQLDPDRRATFILAELEQMTAPEIGRALGANANTIYSRIASARKAFVAFLEDRSVHAWEEPRD